MIKSKLSGLSTLFVCTFTLWLAAGCSSTPPQISGGQIRAQTFSFFQPGGAPPVFVESGQDIHAAVQTAISRNLAQRGVTLAPGGGDVMVAYLIITGNNGSISSVNDYFGYTDDALALADKAMEEYTSEKHRNYFEAGTLLIDIVDPKTQKVLWRNYAVRPLQPGITADARQQRIQEAVDAILQKARIN